MALTFSITGGADATKFTIGASTGVLAFKTAPDFEQPGDADTNNVYIVEIGVSDGVSTTKQTISVTVTDVADSNLPPQITSPATKTVQENSTVVMTVTATDPDEATPTGSIPLSWSDSRFASNTTSMSVTLSNGQNCTRKSITDTGHTASIICNGNNIIDTCRVNSREGVRVGGTTGGTYDIRNSYLEATGSGADHADTIQAYAPNTTGAIIITDTSVVAHNTAATAGMFVADNWSGTVTLTNVVFNGGPYGLRIHGNVTLRAKDVFFVGPFAFNKFLLECSIAQWDNVREATISGGVLVPGAAIPRP